MLTYELAYALTHLDHETPAYLKREAVTVPHIHDFEAFESDDAASIARDVLSSPGNPLAVRLLKDILSAPHTLHIRDV